MIQQVEYDLNNRCLRFGQFTTGIPLSEFTESAADRANKVLSFSSTGDPTITQELGVWNGNWATSTAYVVRDLVKDTSNNNVYICLTVHTSSGSQPISTDTDSAKWALLIDAATATSSATAAAASATAAASSASAASTSETNAATSATNAATSATNAATSETNAASSATSASTSATTATTQATAASASATAASTSETNAASSATSASTSATNASTSETNAATSATAAQTAQAAAEAALDNFDDTYLGAKASDPTLDNDGDALTAGDMYFNTTTDRMRIYDGAAWADVALDSASVVSQTSETGAAEIPTGTTAQRDVSPSVGNFRWNTTEGSAEIYDGSAWGSVGGGAVNEIFYENAQTVSTSYTITTNYNAMTAGPITVDTGVTVTVPTGSTWHVL